MKRSILIKPPVKSTPEVPASPGKDAVAPARSPKPIAAPVPAVPKKSIVADIPDVPQKSTTAPKPTLPQKSIAASVPAVPKKSTTAPAPDLPQKSTAAPTLVVPQKPIAGEGVPPSPVPAVGAKNAAAGKKTPVIERPRSKSVSSARTNSTGQQQPTQRSKSQVIGRNSVNKPPIGYAYSTGPGFKEQKPMGNDAIWNGQLQSQFAPWEIRRLGRRFRKLDMDNSGALSADEFLSLPELQDNPCVQRVLDIFDVDGNGEIDFREFIHGIALFSIQGDKESKLNFLFNLYDMDKDGFISNGELFQVLKMLVGSNFKDRKLQQVVDKTIIYADKDGDGKISFDEFCYAIGAKTEVHRKKGK